MPRRIVHLSLCILFGSFAALTTLAEEAKDTKSKLQTYTVKLERPSKLGDKVDLSITATSKETSTTLYDDRDPQVETTAAQAVVEGRGETLAVDAKGNETKVSIRLTKAQTADDGKSKDILPKGTLLIVELKGDKTVFTVNGEAVSDEAEEALSLALNMHDPRTHSDDEVFANDRKPKVGDTWPLNAELAAKDLTTLGLPVDKKTVTGKTTLLGVQDSNGVPCLHLLLEMTADHIKPEMTEGVTVTKDSMQMLLHTLVPIDETSPYVIASLATRFSMTARRAAGKDGPATTVRTVTERGRAITVKAVK